MSRINAGLVDTSSFQRVKQHVPTADQRAARRKALLGEQETLLSIEQIKQRIENEKTAAAEGQRKAKAAEEIRQIRQRGGTPQQIVDAVSAVDPAEGDRLRALYQAEADKTFDAVNKTPGETLFEGATLSATPGSLNTDDGSDSVLRGTMTADIPAGEIAPVEVGHAPIERPGMMGPTKIRPITAREFSQMNAKEALAKMEEQSRLARETSAIARQDASQLKRDEMELAAKLRPEPVAPQGAAVLQEYNFYADQERAAGRKPLSFDEYQARDANRRRVAPPAPTVIVTGSGPQLVDRNTGTATPVKDASGNAIPIAPTAEQRNFEMSIKKMDPVLNGISELSEKINTGAGLIAKMEGGARKVAAKANYDDDVAEYEALISGFTPMVARAVGHTGVLTQQDVDSVRALFPKPGDSKTLRDRKINRIKTILGEISSPGGAPDAGQRKEQFSPSSNQYRHTLDGGKTWKPGRLPK